MENHRSGKLDESRLDTRQCLESSIYRTTFSNSLLDNKTKQTREYREWKRVQKVFIDDTCNSCCIDSISTIVEQVILGDTVSIQNIRNNLVFNTCVFSKKLG